MTHLNRKLFTPIKKKELVNNPL